MGALTTNPLSDYAKFHMEFMGYNFYDHTLKRLIPKYVLWATKQELCKTMTRRGEAISRYSLIKRRDSKSKF